MSVLVVQLYGAVKYADCFSAEGVKKTPLTSIRVAQSAGNAEEYNDIFSAMD